MIGADRRREPLTPDLPVFKLPPVAEYRTANGLTLLVLEDRRFPLVSVRVGLEGGSKYEPADLTGLADSAALLLTEGTSNRSAKQIADEVAGMGGSLRADASPDSLMVTGSALAENLDPLLELTADVLRNPTFAEDEVALRKQHRTQELLAQLSDAGFLADEKINRFVFGEHPYARQEPTLESIERLNRDALVSFHRARVAPEGGIVVLLGNFPGDPRELVERRLGEWIGAPAPAPDLAAPPEPKPGIVMIDRPGSVQADIRIGRLAITRTDPDYFPLLLGNAVLGGGASSRLFMNVREAKGYAYDARSSSLPYRDAGMFVAVTQVRNEVLSEAVETVLEEMWRMSREDVTAEELATVKNYLCGTFVIRLETQESLAAQLMGTKLMGLPLEYLEQYTGRVRAVQPDRIRAAAARYMNPDEAAMVVVGDAAELLPRLEKFGKVTVEKAG